jgi:hypothetical protein
MIIFGEIYELSQANGCDSYSPTGEYFLSEVKDLVAVKTVGETGKWIWSLRGEGPDELKGQFFRLRRVPNSVV